MGIKGDVNFIYSRFSSILPIIHSKSIVPNQLSEEVVPEPEPTVLPGSNLRFQWGGNSILLLRREIYAIRIVAI